MADVPPAAPDSSSSLRVLITNITLSGRTGTEIQTRNIALELLRQGHRPIVYAPTSGPIADELRAASVPVVSEIAKVQVDIDVIHGHHTPTTATAVARFPDCPAIFVCHDAMAWHDTPPHLPAIRRTLAVDDATADRLVAQEGLAPSAVHVLLNAVDTRRFAPGPPLPSQPRRALALAKNLEHLEGIASACLAQGLPVDVIGPAVGKMSAAPEALMPDYDIVFASALGAMEAMACGRAVVVVDGRGLAGMVDPARFAQWRRLNFGLRTLRSPPSAAAITGELARYDPDAATQVAHSLRAEGGMPEYVRRLVAVYRDVILESNASPLDRSAVAAAHAAYLERWSPRVDAAWPWMQERAVLLQRIEFAQLPVMALAAGDVIQFGQLGTMRHLLTLRGFSHTEDWGVWTEGHDALLLLRIAEERADASVLHFEVEALVHPLNPVVEADIVVNGSPAAVWRFELGQDRVPTTRMLVVPPSIVPRDGRLWIEVRTKHPMSPQELGISGDPRKLGIAFHSVALRQASDVDA